MAVSDLVQVLQIGRLLEESVSLRARRYGGAGRAPKSGAGRARYEPMTNRGLGWFDGGSLSIRFPETRA